MKKIEESAFKFLKESRIIDSRWVTTSFMIYYGRPLFFESHYDRLQKGVQLNFGTSLKYSASEILESIFEEFSKSKLENSPVSLKIVTNGMELFFYERSEIDILKKEYKVKTFLLSPAERLMSNEIKPASYEREAELLNKLKMDELIFYNQDKLLLEAVYSSVCLVKNGSIYFPVENPQILKGVLSQNLFNFLKMNKHYDFEFKKLSLNDIFEAEEVWLLNCLRGIRKVVQIDEHLASSSFPLFNKIINEFGFFGEKVS